MIKFEAKKHKGASKIIDWSKVEFVDGAEDKRPIKRITLDIDAGGVAEVIVERYVMAKDEDGYVQRRLSVLLWRHPTRRYQQHHRRAVRR